MYRILLVEDDLPLAEAMQQQLERYGNKAERVRDLTNVLGEVRAYRPHLVLMDIRLPWRDGYYWCRELRRESTVPVVFISSASDSMDIVMAIGMGGDDFIAKPVDPAVFIAKVQAILRRTYELSDAAPSLEFHGAELHPADGCVTKDDVRVELTRNEERILHTLLENRGRIVSRNELMTRLWQDDCYVEENTLTVNVARLRRKLESCGLTDVIRTRPGSGYILS